MLPPYVYDLIAAVQQWEDEHAKGSACFNAVLSTVPAEERDRAAAIAAYNRQTIPIMVIDGHAYRMPPFSYDEAAASDQRPGEPMCVACSKLVARFDEPWYQENPGTLCAKCRKLWCDGALLGEKIAETIRHRQARERGEASS